MAKITKSDIEEMLEEGVDDCTGTIEELSELIDEVFAAVNSGDEEALEELREHWEG